jgi:hypothetical protein
MKGKKIAGRLFFLGAMVLAALAGSCSNQMLPMPVSRSVLAAGDDGISSPWGAPTELSASQGKKRSITLSWKPVSGAVRYLIYRSESPLLPFTQCGETANNTPEFNAPVNAGAAWYYQVAAVNERGEYSSRSPWVSGRSLAQPAVYLIEPDSEDAGLIRVYWSMNNLESQSYEDAVRYTLYCYGAGGTSAEYPVSGSFAGDPFYMVSGLAGSTEYEFEVRAWLDGNPEAAESSGRFSATTARRMNPGAPAALTSIPGGEKQSVTLSFNLPEQVDVLEGGSYVLHDVYFVVSRREAGTGGTFQVIDSYVGSDAGKAGGTADFSPYTQGQTVFWTDRTILESQRGIMYEYKVQSHVEGTDRTSSASIATVTGWAMKKPALSFGVPAYTQNEDVYVSAELPLVFTHDTLGVEYEYVIHGTIAPIGDSHENDASGAVAWDDGPLSLPQMQAYATAIDLTVKTASGYWGRGQYSYSVDVRLAGSSGAIDTVHAVGSQRVFEKNLAYLNIEDFAVQDGYTGKFVLTWKKKAGLVYKLASAPAAAGPWTSLTDVSAGGAEDNYTYTVSGQAAGISRYFSISAYDEAEGLTGNTVYTPAAAQTLGTPVLSLDPALSYDAITLVWDPVQKADHYRVLYRYQGASTFSSTGLIAADGLSQTAGKYRYLLKPEGSDGIDAAKAGKPMEIQLEALNRARQTADGGGEVKTLSGMVSGARLFGPAGLEQTITASQNAAADSITLSWGEVTGAKGYYVIRRQYGMDNGSPRGGADILYYVNAQTRTITGKDIATDDLGTPEDSGDVSAELGFAAGTFSLKDKAMADAVYLAKEAGFGRYAREQNEMLWGFPYRYHVIPVLAETPLPAITGGKLAVGGARYSETSTAALAKTGRALGFVTGVRATKGTYSSGGSVNDGIKVEWTRPGHIPPEKTVNYRIFRRGAGEGAWTNLSPATAHSGVVYIDTALTPGTAYEYLVGISLDGMDTQPNQNGLFVAWNQEIMDEDFPEERQMAGFVLSMPTMVSASRTENLDAESGRYYEIVTWNAAGIDNAGSDNKNRGITGYEIQVRDQSPERAWQTVKTVLMETESDRKQFEFSVPVFNENGLLNVLRDYRHYFRVRAFASDHGDKAYSTEPPTPPLDGTENGYVKWGARQINAEEFAGLTSFTIGNALKSKGMLDSTSSDPQNVSLNHTPFFQQVAGTLTVDVTIGTVVLAKYVKSYDAYTTTAGPLTFTAAPADLDFTYNGTVAIANLKSGSGTYTVTYNGSTASVDGKFVTSPFTFNSFSYVFLGDNKGEFKDCSGLYNWNESSGWQ